MKGFSLIRRSARRRLFEARNCKGGARHSRDFNQRSTEIFPGFQDFCRIAWSLGSSKDREVSRWQLHEWNSTLKLQWRLNILAKVENPEPSESHQRQLRKSARNWPLEICFTDRAGDRRAVATFFILKRPSDIRSGPVNHREKAVENVQSGRAMWQRVAQTNQSLVRGLKK